MPSQLRIKTRGSFELPDQMFTDILIKYQWKPKRNHISACVRSSEVHPKTAAIFKPTGKILPNVIPPPLRKLVAGKSVSHGFADHRAEDTLEECLSSPAFSGHPNGCIIAHPPIEMQCSMVPLPPSGHPIRVPITIRSNPNLGFEVSDHPTVPLPLSFPSEAQTSILVPINPPLTMLEVVYGEEAAIFMNGTAAAISIQINGDYAYYLKGSLVDISNRKAPVKGRRKSIHFSYDVEAATVEKGQVVGLGTQPAAIPLSPIQDKQDPPSSQEVVVLKEHYTADDATIVVRHQSTAHMESRGPSQPLAKEGFVGPPSSLDQLTSKGNKPNGSHQGKKVAGSVVLTSNSFEVLQTRDEADPPKKHYFGDCSKAFPKAAGLGSFTSLNVKSEVTTLVTPGSVPGPDKLKLKPTETVMEFPYPTPPQDASWRATEASEGWSSNLSKDTDLELRIARKSPSLEAEALCAAASAFSLADAGYKDTSCCGSQPCGTMPRSHTRADSEVASRQAQARPGAVDKRDVPPRRRLALAVSPESEWGTRAVDPALQEDEPSPLDGMFVDDAATIPSSCVLYQLTHENAVDISNRQAPVKGRRKSIHFSYDVEAATMEKGQVVGHGTQLAVIPLSPIQDKQDPPSSQEVVVLKEHYTADDATSQQITMANIFTSIADYDDDADVAVRHPMGLCF
ncbi:hypothetical protein Nepgr_031795 [Nepenthes gracilis]|uniref:Uncharacterized protein n=1 Tax=Nepenthes gracilis TaxID=150966 RepID=A0AAD3Y550_NEPGR|nr:hypothetical protein Nepgr_031795 [Nepenthes gracilis]